MAGAGDTPLEQLLRQAPLFASCEEAQLARIARAVREVRVPAGTAIFRHGEIGTEFFLLLEGEAVVKRYGRRIASLKPGSTFGELGLLTGLRRSASVVTTTDATMLALSQEDFSALLDEMPRLAHKLLADLARRFYEVDAKSLTH